MHISGDIGFQVLDKTVTFYGLFIVLGIAAGAVLAYVQARVHKQSFDNIALLACICGICGFLGAKLLYLIVSLPHIDASRLTDPVYLVQLASSGFVFYGGLIGALAGIPLSGKLFKFDAFSPANIVTPCLALGHGIGRFGCLVVGCCYGMPYDGPLSVVYDHSIAAPNGIPLLPVQLIEACCEFVLAAVLLVYVNKFRGRRAVAVYIGCYAVVRFVLEFFRFDDVERGMAAGLSTSQWISIALLAIIVIWILFARKREQRAR